MWESRPVELVLQLPEVVAVHVEQTQRTNPDFLSRVIRYGLIRRAIFEELRDTTDPPNPSA